MKLSRKQQHEYIKQLDVIKYALLFGAESCEPTRQCSRPTASPHHTRLLAATGSLSTDLWSNGLAILPHTL